MWTLSPLYFQLVVLPVHRLELQQSNGNADAGENEYEDDYEDEDDADAEAEDGGPLLEAGPPIQRPVTPKH